MAEDANIAANGGEQETYTPAGPTGTDKFNSISEAARALSGWRHEKSKEAAAPEDASVETREEIPSQEGDAGPADEQLPSEAEGDDPAEEKLPPVDAPRSWDKADKEWFAQLPRETQERIAEREGKRETEFRQRQNEAATQSKAAEAARQQAEQERSRYEQATQQGIRMLEGLQAAEFSDVKTHEDLVRLAEEDPFRYNKFQARREQIQNLRAQDEHIQRVKAQESATRWKDWATQQDEAFSSAAKEFDDPATASKAREATIEYLTKVRGMEKETLVRAWNDPDFKFHIRDQVFQFIARDAMRFHKAQQDAKARVSKDPLPPVQRPGTAPARGERQSSELQAASSKLDRTGSLKDAAALLTAQRKQQARRA